MGWLIFGLEVAGGLTLFGIAAREVLRGPFRLEPASRCIEPPAITAPPERLAIDPPR